MCELFSLLSYIFFYATAITLIGGGILFIIKGLALSLEKGREIVAGLILITIGILIFFIVITVQLGYARLTINI